MNRQPDESKRLRVRDATLVDAIGQGGRDPSLGLPCVVAQTKKVSTYPTNAQRFFACSPMAVMGTEAEGGAGDLSPLNSTLFALNLGSAIPPIGTNLVVTFVDNRWVFRHDG